MKKTLFATMLAFCAAPLLLAEGPADDVKAAAKKLAEADNYAWKQTTSMGQNSRFNPGATEGKAQKDGLVCLTTTRGETTMTTLIKNGKSVTKGQEGTWRTPEESAAARRGNGGGEGGQGGDRRGRGAGNFGRMYQNFKAPAAQAEELAGKVGELKKTEDSITGALTEEAAKEMLSFGGRGPRRDGQGGQGGGERQGPQVSNPKGTVTFWLKDGALAKMEVKVSGSMSFNGEDREIERTTTTEISGVGSSKIDAPEEAVKKLDAPAEAPKTEAPKSE